MSLRKLSFNSVLYFASSFFLRGFGIIILPLLTGHLTVVEYGNYATLIALSGLVSIFFSLNIQSAIQRFYFDEDNAHYRKELIISCTLFTIVNSILVFVVLTVFQGFGIANYLQVDFFPYIFLILLREPFEAVNTVYTYTLYTQEKGIRVSIYSICYALSNLFFLFLFIDVLSLGLYGALLSFPVNSFIFSLVSIQYLLRGFRRAFLSVKLVIQALTFALPLLPGFYIGYLVLSLDRIWLANKASAVDAAVYDVSVKVASILQMLTVSINLAFKPWLFKNFELIKDQLSNISFLLNSFYLVTAVIINAISIFLIDLLTNDSLYLKAVFYVPLITFAWVLRGYDFFLTGIIQQSKENVKYLSFALALSGLIGLLITYLLISHFGIMGAGIGKLVIFTLIPFSYWVIIKRRNLGKINFASNLFFIGFGLMIAYYIVYAKSLIVSSLMVFLTILVVAIFNLKKIKELKNLLKL